LENEVLYADEFMGVGRNWPVIKIENQRKIFAIKLDS
jgi:hypothetical protein